MGSLVYDKISTKLVQTSMFLAEYGACKQCVPIKHCSRRRPSAEPSAVRAAGQRATNLATEAGPAVRELWPSLLGVAGDLFKKGIIV